MAKTKKITASFKLSKQQIASLTKLTVYEGYHKEWLNQKIASGRATDDEIYEARKLQQKQLIHNMVVRELNGDGNVPQLSQPQNPVRPKGTLIQEQKNRDNQLKRWSISTQAVSIVARSIYAYGNLYLQDKASTDRVQKRIHGIRAGESFISASLSLINPALASAWSFAEQIFTKRITNGIQRRGDARRIAYNFANYDLGKYGTYAYDNTSQEWIAQDANKVKARSLGQKQSV